MKKLEAFYKESPTKAKTRKAIVRQAARIFSEEGIKSVPLKHITDACGINVRNLYRYYPSKDYLVFDVAYELFSQFEEIKVRMDISGYDQLKAYLAIMFEPDHVSIQFIQYLMYFDLYIIKMDKAHLAYQNYVRVYRQHFEGDVHGAMKNILKKGIGDGSILIEEAEVDFYVTFLIQSINSLMMRVFVKERENPEINYKLVEKQIEMILYYLGGQDA